MTAKKTPAKSTTGRTSGTKPNTPSAPKRRSPAKKPVAKAKPLPPPDAPEHDDHPMNAELLALDATNMVGDTDFDAPASPNRFAFLDKATPLVPEGKTKPAIIGALTGLLIGLLIGGGILYPRGYNSGFGDGQRLAYLTVSIEGMQHYLKCTDAPPACSQQQATAMWAKTLAEEKLKTVEGDAGPELMPAQ